MSPHICGQNISDKSVPEFELVFEREIIDNICFGIKGENVHEFCAMHRLQNCLLASDQRFRGLFVYVVLIINPFMVQIMCDARQQRSQ